MELNLSNTSVFDFLYICFILSIIFIVPPSHALHDASITIHHVSPHSVIISWSTSNNSSECDFSYVIENGSRIIEEGIMPVVAGNKHVYKIHIKNLQENSVYDFTVNCKDVMWITKDYFSTSSNDTTPANVTMPPATSSDTSTITTPYPTAPSENLSTLDIVLGSVSAVIAIAVLGILAFFAYRGYQRRRRIRQFFRHHQLAQPFPGDVM